MEWSKIPTNLINGKFEDAEILAIVKYQLLYALYEEKPNEKILSRFLTKKQKNIVKNFVSVIQPNVEKEITSVQKKRQTDRLYYAENKEKCKNSDNLSDNLSDNCQSEQIREDKIREDINTHTQELAENEKLYGTYANVLLTNSNYKKLQGICLSNELLETVINELSEAIEIGRYEGYKNEHPNAHYVLLQKFIKNKRNNPRVVSIKPQKTYDGLF